MIKLVRPVPGKYVPLIHFGFSVEKLPAEKLPDDFFMELPERFSAAELPYFLIDSPIQTDGLAQIHGCGLTERNILENLSPDRTGLTEECIAGTAGNIEQLSSKGVKAGVLDLDFSIPLSQDREELYLKILHGLAHVLERTDFRLLLPFPVPGGSEETVRKTARFLKRTLLPWVKIRLDIHSHELQPGYSPEKLAGELLNETGAVRFIYLAETGNVLVPEHILPWIEALTLYGFRGPCFFTPAASSLNGLPAWVAANEALLAKIEK